MQSLPFLPPLSDRARRSSSNDDAGGVAADAPVATVATVSNETPAGLLPLTVLAVAALVVWMRDLLAPMAAAALLAAMFWPIVAALRRRRVPTAISAALIVLSLVGIVVSAIASLSAPVEDLAERWPTWRERIEREVGAWRHTIDGSMVMPAAAGGAVLVSTPPAGTAESSVLVTPAGAMTAAGAGGISWWAPLQKLGELAVGGAQIALVTIFTLFLSLFTFLAFGHRVVRAALQGFGRSSRGRILRDALSTAQSTLQAYWGTVAMINLGVGVVMSLVFWAVGLPHALLWGALAGLFNFVPMVGPTIFVALVTLVSFTAFDTVGAALLAPGLYLLVHLIEGQYFAPMLLGRRLRLNPAIVIVSILFWTWAWGVLGTLLAVPALLCLKLVCEHHPDLTRFGALLE